MILCRCFEKREREEEAGILKIRGKTQERSKKILFSKAKKQNWIDYESLN